MSVEEASGEQRAGMPWSAPSGGTYDYAGLGARRRVAWPRIARGGEAARGPTACMRRDALFRRLLLVADVVAVVWAFALASALSSRSLQLTWLTLACVAVVLVGAKVSGLYDRDEALLRKTTLDEAPKLFQLATLCALIAWLAGQPIVGRDLGRREALFVWLALAAGLALTRAAARAFALRVAPEERCLFIGDETSAGAIGSRLRGHGGVNAEVVAQLDLDMAAPWATDGFSAVRLAEVRDLARTLDVQRVIIAPGWSADADPVRMLNLVRTLKAVGVRVSVLPRMLEVVGSSVEFDDLHGMTVMGVRGFELTRSSAALKRAFDLLGVAIGLIAAAPLMIVIAIAVKLDGGGPVLFRQLRVGRHGRRFAMLKFRTMVPGADEMKDALLERNEVEGGMFKIADDPRVTRVGRLLRKSALDELPQLLNVLRGEMSLVGPRPLVIDEDRQIAGWNRRRLELTPGMTGPWQILGHTRVPLHEMVAIDYLYIANWSLWNDVKILLRTVPHVLWMRGL
jgi:exopolysaccharide biosynthesis polyprenyl glycosylphosphotransferase